MKIPARFSAAFGIILLAGAVAPTREPDRYPLEIHVDDEGWGDAAPVDIRKVLESAGQALLAQVPDLKLPPIEVSRSRKGPLTLFESGPRGEFRVRLDVEGRGWAQFAFQFGHELCHIVCGCVDHPNPY